MMHHMKAAVLLVILILSNYLFLSAQDLYEQDNLPIKDTISKKELHQIKRAELKNSHRRFMFLFGGVYANMNTGVAFDLPSGHLTASIKLEDDFGLPGTRSFFNGAFIYRITPRSGIYAHYYGINRKNTNQTEDDLIFITDSIPAGTTVNSYFNTQVFSAGYLLSILENQNIFLGAYFNIYLMALKTGVNSEYGDIDASVNLLAPIPNFGFIAMIKLTNWLHLDGNVGFFSLYTSDFGGTIYSLNVSLLFKATEWLGFSLYYQEFDINVFFPSNSINTTISYNFKGPALGVKFTF